MPTYEAKAKILASFVLEVKRLKAKILFFEAEAEARRPTTLLRG